MLSDTLSIAAAASLTQKPKAPANPVSWTFYSDGCPASFAYNDFGLSRSAATIANVAASATVRASVQAGHGKPPTVSPCEPVARQRHRAMGTCPALVPSLWPPLVGQYQQPPHAAGQMVQEIPTTTFIKPMAHPTDVAPKALAASARAKS